MLANEMYVVGSCYETTLFGYNWGEITQDREGINNLRRLAENMGVLLQKLSGQLPGWRQNHMEI